MTDYILISPKKVGIVPCQAFIHHSFFFLLLWAQKCLLCLIDSLLDHGAGTREGLLNAPLCRCCDL